MTVDRPDTALQVLSALKECETSPYVDALDSCGSNMVESVRSPWF